MTVQADEPGAIDDAPDDSDDSIDDPLELKRNLELHEKPKAFTLEQTVTINPIEERRLKALCHGQCYQQRVARSFNRKVRPRQFQEGDLVLRKVLPIIQDPRGKFAPNYSGPFIVTKALPGGALILAEMDGREFSNPVNADAVKKYYP